jgi:hypothetical protein
VCSLTAAVDMNRGRRILWPTKNALQQLRCPECISILRGNVEHPVRGQEQKSNAVSFSGDGTDFARASKLLGPVTLGCEFTPITPKYADDHEGL